MTETTPAENPKQNASSLWVKMGISFSILGIIILILAYGYGYLELLRLNHQLSQMTKSVQQDESAKAITALQNNVNDIQQSLQKSQAMMEEWRRANLEVQPNVDVTSIFLRINVLHDLVDKLPLPIQPLQSE